MKAETSLSFIQLLELVKQLPKRQKIQLSKKREKYEVHSKLSQLLNIFQTDELSYE